MEDVAIFRPCKRRKFIRHGPLTEDDVGAPQLDSQAIHTHSEHVADAEDSNVGAILKLRRQQRLRTGGVQFSSSKLAATDDGADSTALVRADNPTDDLKGIADRFVGHSGQVVDVDKHMVAYIDSEMAKRRIAHASTGRNQPENHEDSEPTNESPVIPAQPSTRQPTSQGLLHEVEVMDNKPRPLEPALPKPRKPRLDRFGRPLPPRKSRKGRAESDIARDKLVEDIMNESGLDVYQTHNNPSVDFNGDGDADSRLASQFQQDYLDAMQSRQQAQKKAIPGAEPGQKGPKLGGSRQQRAAMRERELKDEKGKGSAG